MKTTHPTTDVVVAGYNVVDFGARGDGTTDCTQAFQQALDQMSLAGGGTVFVPAGRYVIQGHLLIPPSVTLRGDWQAPTTANRTATGTVLMAFEGRGNTDGDPFITVDHSAGIKHLTIWYPEQSAAAPIPYPFCLVQKGGNNATFENLTLLNPYQGIRIGPGGNELHYVHNVYGTPLKVGVQYDGTTDIGRLENIRFSPRYWMQSHLPGAPVPGDPLEAWLLEQGTAIHMFRSDWEYVAYIMIDGYRRGFQVSESDRGAANAQFYYLLIENCGTAIEVEEANPFGMVFTKCKFQGSRFGIKLSKKFDSAVLLSHCSIGGIRAVQAEGKGTVMLERCTITGGDVAIVGGVFSMTASTVKHPRSRIYFGPEVMAASLADCRLAGGRGIVASEAPPGAVTVSTDPVPVHAFPEYDGNQERDARPAKPSLTVVSPTGGYVRNTQFNPHYWGRSPPGNPFFANRPARAGKSSKLWALQKENLDAIVVADCTDQFLFQNFVYGSLYGIHFTRQQDTGPVNCISHGHGTDGSKVGVFFEQGSENIYMINNQLVAMSSANKTAIKLDKEFSAGAALFNTLVWGSPDLLAEVDNGRLLLQGLHAHRHGEGIRVNQGKVFAVNANFANHRGNHLGLADRNAAIVMTGCVTTGALQVDGAPYKQGQSDGRIKVTNQLQRPEE